MLEPANQDRVHQDLHESLGLQCFLADHAQRGRAASVHAEISISSTSDPEVGGKVASEDLGLNGTLRSNVVAKVNVALVMMLVAMAAPVRFFGMVT